MGNRTRKTPGFTLDLRQDGTFSVVSVEWLAQSLVAGVQLKPEESRMFSLDTMMDDIYYISKANIVPVRYTIDDIVRYNTESLPCIGASSA